MQHAARYAAALAVVVTVAGSAPPEVRAADLPSILTEYSVASWGQKDGFPLGNTWSIVQDEDGYLWLGTDTGLFRFDGVRFVPWIAPQVEPYVATVGTQMLAGAAAAEAYSRARGVQDERLGRQTDAAAVGGALFALLIVVGGPIAALEGYRTRREAEVEEWRQ